MRYVARPVEIDAVQWKGSMGDLPPEWRAHAHLELVDGALIVRTLEGPATVRHGDYLVRGTAGEFYPVKRPIFEAKYEAV